MLQTGSILSAGGKCSSCDTSGGRQERFQKRTAKLNYKAEQSLIFNVFYNCVQSTGGRCFCFCCQPMSDTVVEYNSTQLEN